MARRAGALGVLAGSLVGTCGALLGRPFWLTMVCCAGVAVALVLLLIDQESLRG